MPDRLTVAGGSVAALVCAWAGARAGREVDLLLPERGVGGGFAGLVRDGRRLPLGARLLELDHESAPPVAPPLREDAGGSHLPQLARIRAVVEELAGAGLTEAGAPRTVRRGRWGADPYWAASLDGLADLLTDAERAQVAEEAAAAEVAEGEAGLLAPERADELDSVALTGASERMHGARLHGALVEAMGRKIRPEAGDDVPAALRRRVWLALFWPRTVHEAARGAPPAFRPRRPFHTVAPGGVETLVDALVGALEHAPRVRMRRTGALRALAAVPAGIRLAFTDGHSVEAPRAVLGAPPAEAFAAVGAPYAPTRLRSVIAWLEAPTADVERLAPLVHFADPEIPAFRASTFTAGVAPERTGFCVELRHDVEEATIVESAAASLESGGVLSTRARVVPITSLSASVLVAPTFANRDAFAAARERFDSHALPVRLVGGGADFAADSFNEQVLQGLRAAEAD